MSRNKVPIEPIRGKRLKKLIEDQGLTQKEFADKVNLTQQTVSKIINGKANLTEGVAREIVELFPSYGYEYLMGFKFDRTRFTLSPLEFEKGWHRAGGGPHTPDNIYAAEGRTAVALERMNKDGWQVAVDLIESLAKVPAFQAEKECTVKDGWIERSDDDEV